MKKNYIVRQESISDCGASCLLSIIRFYGGDANKEVLIRDLKTTKEGTNFYSLKEVAGRYGLMAKGYVIEDINKIKMINPPFIAQLKIKEGYHFVVIYKIEEDNLIIMDPSLGKRKMDIFEFTSMWTGYILLFEKVDDIPLYISDKVLNKIIISSLYRNKSIVIMIIILSILFTIFASLSSLYTQTIFDKVLDTSLNNIVIITILFSILIIIKNVTSYVRNYIIIFFNQKLDISMVLSSFSKIIYLPYYYYKNKSAGEVLSRINDLVYVKNFITKVIATSFLDVFTLIISLIIIYKINKNILLVIIIIAGLYLIIILLFNPFIKKTTRLVQEKSALVNSNIIERVGSFETIKGLHIEDNIINSFSKVYSGFLNKMYEREKVSNNLLFIKEIIMDLGLLLINYMAIKYITEGNVTSGEYMTIIFFSGYTSTSLRNIISTFYDYHIAKSTINRLNNLLEVEIDNYEEEKLTIDGNIKIRNLSFSYNNKNNILDNVSFDIKKGERVLVLGPSGCGKSSVMKILYKYYNVSRDMIYIDGYDINDYNLSDIRNNFTYISQNELLYQDTIHNNIVLNRNISNKLFLNVSRVFYVDDIIKDNFLGYDYNILENGVNISGGQRQRIILARSLIKDSKVVMIDEGFSQIDVNLERKILKNMFYYFKDRTFIVVSHRKDNMDLYDKVIILDKEGAHVIERRDS